MYDILGTPDAKDKMARQEMLFSRMLNDETLNEGTLCHKKPIRLSKYSGKNGSTANFIFLEASIVPTRCCTGIICHAFLLDDTVSGSSFIKPHLEILDDPLLAV